MNRIVREHYPVAKLPEDLQVGLDQGASVKVIVVAERTDLARRMAIFDKARTLRAQGIIATITEAEAVERVRRLRDD